MKSIDLLNSGEPILRAIKYNSDRFDIVDRYNFLVDILSAKELLAFVEGREVIFDSKAKKYYYPSFHDDMKPGKQVLKAFIGVN